MAQIGLPGFGDFDVVWKLRFWSDHWYQNPNWDSGLIIDTKIILSHNLISIRLDANLGPPFVPKDLGCTLCMPYNAVWKLRFWSDHRHQNHIEPQYDFDTVGSKFRTSFCSERSGLYIVDHIMHNSKMKINVQCPGLRVLGIEISAQYIMHNSKLISVTRRSKYCLKRRQHAWPDPIGGWRLVPCKPRHGVTQLMLFQVDANTGSNG